MVFGVATLHLAPARCSEDVNESSQKRITWLKGKKAVTWSSAPPFTWFFCRMTEVGLRRSSLSTMAFTSVLLFICSIYSCYAQAPLLMWTSDGYVTRLYLEYCLLIHFYSNSRTLLCSSYICSLQAARSANSDIQKRSVEVHYSGQGLKSAWFCWGESQWYLCRYRSNMPHLAQPTAGQTVSGGQLASYLKSALSIAPHNVLLFLQDKVKCPICLKCGEK